MENSAALGNWGISGPPAPGLLFRRALAKEARQLLESIEQQRNERRNASAARCPKCDHAPAKSRLHPIRKAGIVALILAPVITVGGSFVDIDSPVRSWAGMSAVVIGMILLFVTLTPRWVCAKCGHQWAMPETESAEDED